MSLSSTQALDTLRMDMERTQRNLRIEKDKLEKLEGEVKRSLQDQKAAKEQHELQKRVLDERSKQLHDLEEAYAKKDRDILREQDRLKQRQIELDHHRHTVERMEQEFFTMKRNVEDLQRKMSMQRG